MIYDLFGSLCGCGNSFRLWPFMLTHELITRFCFLASKSNVLETRFLHSMVDWNKSGSFIENKIANHIISSIKKRSAFFHSPHIFSKGNSSDSRMLKMWSRGFLSKSFLETKFPSECIALPKGIRQKFGIALPKSMMFLRDWALRKFEPKCSIQSQLPAYPIQLHCSISTDSKRCHLWGC